MKNLNSDIEFNQLLDCQTESISNLHWTPHKVIHTAVSWLGENKQEHILDIGSGVGKFCILGALSSSAKFTGIEQRKNLVNTSNKIARENNISNATFIHGNFTDLDFSNYTSFYLYNPFWENISNDQLIDNKIPISEELYTSYNKELSKKLSALKKGTLVVTYLMKEEHIPANYLIIKKAFNDDLLLWKKH